MELTVHNVTPSARPVRVQQPTARSALPQPTCSTTYAILFALTLTTETIMVELGRLSALLAIINALPALVLPTLNVSPALLVILLVKSPAELPASLDMDQAQLLVCVCSAPALALAAIKPPLIAFRVSYRQPNITSKLSAVAPHVWILVQLVITPTTLLSLAFSVPLVVMIAVAPPTATAAVQPIFTTIVYATILAPLVRSLKQPLTALFAMNTALAVQCLPIIAQPATPTAHTGPSFSAMFAFHSVPLPIMATLAPRPASLVTLPVLLAMEDLSETVTSATNPTSSAETLAL